MEHTPHEQKHFNRHANNWKEDNLTPLESLDLSRIKSFDDLVRAMSKTAFGGRLVGEAVDLLEKMMRDTNCFVVGTFAGAMTVAKQGLVITDMIDKGVIHAVVSTGALITHGLVEATGMTHFKYHFGQMDDKELYDKGYDRVYDTLEVEKNLDDLEAIVNTIFDTFDEKNIYSSRVITHEIGKYLSEKVSGRGILKSAYEKNVPVYIPAFTDSELGLDFALYNRRRRAKGLPALRFDPFHDLEHYAQTIEKQEKIGIFTIGGGVPRNWAQQVACYIDLINFRAPSERNGESENEEKPSKRFQYGLRICPEPVQWGGLSGCTYSEGVSWGKFMSPEEGGQFVEVPSDATIVWPLIMKALFERMDMQGISKSGFSDIVKK